MNASHAETTPAVGVSISESPDLHVLGLSDGHLRDAMAEIALNLLASGTSLAYGGDLRQHGFTELLAELVRRYRNHPLHGGTVAVTDYLAWPVHIRMTSNELATFSAEHEPAAHLVFLALDGGRLAREERLELHAREPHEDEWAKGLTGNAECHARRHSGAHSSRRQSRGIQRNNARNRRGDPHLARSRSAGLRARRIRRMRARHRGDGGVSSSVGPVHEMTGPGAIVFGNTLPTTFTTVFPPRKTSSWPGHPTSRKQWPWWTEVSVESAEVKTPRHKVFISYHHANDQWYKNALVDFGKNYSIFVDRSVDTADIPEEWTDQRIRRAVVRATIPIYRTTARRRKMTPVVPRIRRLAGHRLQELQSVLGAELAKNRRALCDSRAEIESVEERLDALPGLQETLARFQEIGLEERLREQSLLVREERVIGSVPQRLAPFREALELLRKELPINLAFLSERALAQLPGREILSESTQVLTDLGKEIERIADDLMSALERADHGIDQVRTAWDVRRQRVQTQYEQILRELQKSRVDGEEFIRLRRQIEELRPLQDRLVLLRRLEKEHDDLRRTLLAEWEDIKAAEFPHIRPGGEGG